MAAQVASQFLLVPEDGTYTGTLYVTLNRLHIRGPSLYGMLATLAILITMVLLLDIMKFHSVVSHDPGSLAGLAVILARSPKLNELLSSRGSSSLATITSALENHKCQNTMTSTAPDQGSAVDLEEHISPSGLSTEALPVDSSDDASWWRPIALSPWLKALTIAALFSSVAALELVLHISQNHEGLADVSETSNVRYTWRFVPGTLMLAVSMIVNMIFANSKTFLPYHDLRHWPCDGRTILLCTESFQVAPIVLYDVFRHKHWSLLATNIAATLTLPLTIISSGLFTLNTVNATHSVTLHVENGLQLASVGVDERFSLATLVLSIRRDRPGEAFGDLPWTFGDLILPRLSLDASNISSQSHGAQWLSEIELDTVAWQPLLDCDLLQEGPDFNITRSSDRPDAIVVSLTQYPDCKQNHVGTRTGGWADLDWADPASNLSFSIYDALYESPDCPYIKLLAVSWDPQLSAQAYAVSVCRAAVNGSPYTTILEYPSLRVGVADCPPRGQDLLSVVYCGEQFG